MISTYRLRHLSRVWFRSLAFTAFVIAWIAAIAACIDSHHGFAAVVLLATGVASVCTAMES
jgi:hypothetical protein